MGFRKIASYVGAGLVAGTLLLGVCYSVYDYFHETNEGLKSLERNIESYLASMDSEIPLPRNSSFR